MHTIDIFPWDDNFNTGIAKIDEQHKMLVKLLNQLANHVAFKSDRPALNVIFDELADYAIYHFKTEEEIWHEYLPADPMESSHKEIHNSFIANVVGLRNQENSKAEDDMVADVLGFLTRWLASHILENDRYLAHVVLAMQSGMPLELAKKHATEQMNGSTRVLIDIILSIYESLSTNTLHLMRELSEHKHYDTELQQSHKLFLSMLEASPIAVRIVSPETRKVLFANERYAKLTNANMENVIGSDPHQFYANPQDYEDTLHQIEQDVPIVEKLVELTIPDSEKVWALATYSRTEYDNAPAVLGWFYDITDILDTEAKLQLLADNVSDVISRHDKEGNYQFVTASCLSLLGYSPEELIGHSCYDFFHPDDLAEVRSTHQQIIDRSVTSTVNYRLKRKDNTYIWVETTVRTTRDANNKAIDIVAATRDISERKRAEQLLLDSEAFNQSVFDSRIENVAVLDTQGVIIAVNTAWEKFALANGSHNNEHVGTNYLEVCASLPSHLHTEYADDAVAGIKKVLSGELKEFTLEYPCHSPEKQRWFNMLVTPLKASQGGAIVAHEDISIRKQAEEKLRASSLYARSLIEASLDPLVTISTEGKIMDVNRATEKVTGVSRDQIIGSDFSDYFTEPAKARAGYQQAFKLGQVTDYPLAIQHKSGAIIEVLYNANVYLDEQGEVAGIFAAARDVTERKRIEAELSKSEANYRNLFDHMQSGFSVHEIVRDENGHIVDYVFLSANAAYGKVTSLSPEHIIGKRVTDVLPGIEHDPGDWIGKFGKVATEGTPIQIEQYSVALGRWFSVFAYQPSPDQFAVLVNDITERKQTELDLKIAAAAFDAQEGMIITDADSVILKINKSFTEITGYTAEEAVGQKMKLLRSGVHDASFYKAMWESINTTGAWRGEIWNRRKNDEIYPEWLTITAIRGNDDLVTHYVGTMIDITARKADELRIAHLAHYDMLTDLPNRAMLTDRLHQAVAQARRDQYLLALMFLDLDKFKIVNDTLGHKVGDLLLKQVAIRLQSCVQRESDTVSRIGGDEFVVLLPRIESEHEAVIVAEKILLALNKPFSIGQHSITIGSSIGIAIYPQHANDVESLMKNSDYAMYQAKSDGRNCFKFFKPEIEVN